MDRQHGLIVVKMDCERVQSLVVETKVTECPVCGTPDILLGVNKYGNTVPVEWTRSNGWTCHVDNCPGCANCFPGSARGGKIQAEFFEL